MAATIASGKFVCTACDMELHECCLGHCACACHAVVVGSGAAH